MFIAGMATHLNMLKNKDITRDLIDHVKKLYIAELQGQGINPMNVIEGDVTPVTYRGGAFDMPATSRIDAFMQNVKALCYSIAVENGSMAPIWDEQHLMKSDISLRHLKVDPELIAEQSMARTCAMQGLNMHESITADILRAMMVQQKDQLSSIDPFWSVTYYAFESIVGIGAQSRFMTMVHSRLPTSARMMTPSESLKELSHLQCMRAMEFMPASCQAQLRAIRNAVDNICHKRRADMPNDGSSSMQSMATKMSLWLTFHDGDQVHRGKRAAEHIYQRLLAIEEKDLNTMELEDIQPLFTFSWLLSESMEEKVSTWMSKIMGRNLMKSNAIVLADSGISPSQRAAVTALTG